MNTEKLLEEMDNTLDLKIMDEKIVQVSPYKEILWQDYLNIKQFISQSFPKYARQWLEENLPEEREIGYINSGGVRIVGTGDDNWAIGYNACLQELKDKLLSKKV